MKKKYKEKQHRIQMRAYVCDLTTPAQLRRLDLNTDKPFIKKKDSLISEFKDRVSLTYRRPKPVRLSKKEPDISIIELSMGEEQIASDQ